MMRARRMRRSGETAHRARAALLYFLFAAGFFPMAPAADQDAAPTPGAGWQYRVYQQDLPGVDNLVVAADGALYATQELADEKGKIVRIHDGKVETLVSGLDRPDGLFMMGKYLYVTEEVSGGRVLEVNPRTGRQRVLETLNKPEGIGMLPDGGLVVSEDTVNGRLIRLRANGAFEVITGGLNRPEGLAVARDGAIYFAETGTGRVLSYKDGAMDTVVDDLDEPDQVRFAPDGALWITEDTKPGRLLRFHDGALEVVMTGLVYPQGIAFTANGTVLVAEQGRGRILAITEAEQ